MTAPTFNQYAPGGCFKQLSDAAPGGSSTTYLQYAPGGPPEQLRVLIDPTLVLYQYSPGGCPGQAAAKLAGGGSVPAWVPANAKIHIDLVGDRAWTEAAGEVAIDMLLGSDPNTSNGWGDTAYDPAGLLPQGYSCGDLAVAFIGVARTALLGSATMTMRYLQIVSEATANVVPIGLLSEDGLDGVTAKLWMSPPDAVMEDYNGNFEEHLANVPDIGLDAVNVAALTITASRFDLALNGGTAVAGVLDAVSRPPGNPLVAALAVSTDEVVMQSITFYDPLPTTAGLSALSAIS